MASTPAELRGAPLAAPPQSALAYGVLRTAFAVVLRLVFRLRVVGLENVPETGPVVLASLHRSNWDTMAVGAPLRHRRLRPMAKIELYRNPLMAWLLRRAGAFPVRRGQGDAEAVATALAILREGGLLAMFPEGTRNPSGKARARSGAARLALAGHAAFVPVAVAGTDDVRLWPPRIPRFRVAYGPPIRLDDLEGAGLRTAADEATERWKAAVAELRAKIA
jgi:1-acyl-sn-glycerol-3-phosphate acyltransferase